MKSLLFIVTYFKLANVHGQIALRAGTQESNYPPAAPRQSPVAAALCTRRMSLVNHNGCAADGNHNHTVGLSHRLVAEANSHDGIGA